MLIGVRIVAFTVLLIGVAQGQCTQNPSTLTKKQGEYYIRLRDLMSQSGSHFANLATGKGAKVTRAVSNTDVEVQPLANPLPEFDFGGVSDPAKVDSYLYFEGTPYDVVRVFEDYKEAIRALFPKGREEPFGRIHWRTTQGNVQIDLRRDQVHTNLHGFDIDKKVTLTISVLR